MRKGLHVTLQAVSIFAVLTASTWAYNTFLAAPSLDGEASETYSLTAPPNPPSLPLPPYGLQVEEPVAPEDASEEQQDDPVAPVASPSLSVPSLDLTVPLEGVRVTNGEVTPPEFDRAYLVDGYSTSLNSAADGRFVVVFHSKRDGSGIGNAFFNQQTGHPTVLAGDTIVVGGNSYRVREISAVSKEQMPERVDVWEAPPGTLALITCLQNPQRTASTENFIVLADLVSN